MQKPLVLAAALSFLAGPALAADLATPEPVPAPVVTTAGPITDWSGFYLGAMLGYSTGESEVPGPDPDVDGVDGGIYVGVQRQFNNFVVGLEGDALLSGVSGSTAGLSVDQNWAGSVRARAGIALDTFLLYTTGGVALSEVEASAGGVSDSNTHWGWTAGLGAEALVTENITAGVEYRYTDYEDKTFSLAAPTGADLDSHSIRARVGYKF
ncbi:outer membrane protein [Afifella pfennigii]|uniref:outer membrane protein n=1 Tax=Afifella pfennigii TaxID=209897 RepID=UPI00146FB5CA|nr:outer membrane protein [Afifella pfennigii]